MLQDSRLSSYFLSLNEISQNFPSSFKDRSEVCAKVTSFRSIISEVSSILTIPEVYSSSKKKEKLKKLIEVVQDFVEARLSKLSSECIFDRELIDHLKKCCLEDSLSLTKIFQKYEQEIEAQELLIKAFIPLELKMTIRDEIVHRHLKGTRLEFKVPQIMQVVNRFYVDLEAISVVGNASVIDRLFGQLEGEVELHLRPSVDRVKKASAIVNELKTTKISFVAASSPSCPPPRPSLPPPPPPPVAKASKVSKVDDGRKQQLQREINELEKLVVLSQQGLDDLGKELEEITKKLRSCEKELRAVQIDKKKKNTPELFKQIMEIRNGNISLEERRSLLKKIQCFIRLLDVGIKNSATISIPKKDGTKLVYTSEESKKNALIKQLIDRDKLLCDISEVEISHADRTKRLNKMYTSEFIVECSNLFYSEIKLSASVDSYKTQLANLRNKELAFSKKLAESKSNLQAKLGMSSKPDAIKVMVNDNRSAKGGALLEELNRNFKNSNLKSSGVEEVVNISELVLNADDEDLI